MSRQRSRFGGKEGSSEHAAAGAAILAGSVSGVLRLAQQIALTHHEWWDGTGYPAGLKHDAIPICGQIVAVADVFDALRHDRPYKRAWPISEATAEIARLNGRQFAPAVIDAFQHLDPLTLVSPTTSRTTAKTETRLAARTAALEQRTASAGGSRRSVERPEVMSRWSAMLFVEACRPTAPRWLTLTSRSHLADGIVAFAAMAHHGRRNRYTIVDHLPLPDPLVGRQRVGDLLRLLAPS